MRIVNGYEIAPEGTADYFYKIVNGTDHEGLFMFAKLDTPTNFMKQSDRDRRCDYYATGAARGFHLWNDDTSLCSCGSSDIPDSLTAAHFQLSDLYCLFPVIEAAPYGVICYCEFHDDDLEASQLTGALNTYTRTLQEQLRLLIEWSYAHTDLDNNEETAVNAHDIVTTLDMPNDLIDWLLTEMPAERVGRYLQGNPDARSRTVQPIPNWLVHDWDYLKTLISECRGFGAYE